MIPAVLNGLIKRQVRRRRIWVVSIGQCVEFTRRVSSKERVRGGDVLIEPDLPVVFGAPDQRWISRILEYSGTVGNVGVREQVQNPLERIYSTIVTGRPPWASRATDAPSGPETPCIERELPGIGIDYGR